MRPLPWFGITTVVCTAAMAQPAGAPDTQAYARNASNESILVTFVPPGADPQDPALRAVCLPPQTDARVRVPPGGPWGVRVAVLGPDCKGAAPRCQATAPARTLAVTVGEPANACAIRELPSAPLMSGPPPNLTVRNDSQLQTWVTIYRYVGSVIPAGRITEAGCVQPGKEGKFTTPADTAVAYYEVRAEFLPARTPQPCHTSAILCDTRDRLYASKHSVQANDFRITAKAQPGQCWWENPYR